MEVVNQLPEIAHAKINKCLQSKESLCRSDTHNARPGDCDAMVLGSFIRALQELGVLPKVAANRMNIKILRISIEELSHKLSTLAIKSPHSQCSVSPLKEQIAEKLRSIPDPVLDSHRRHMKEQSGVEQ
jgi:hypothetical protein